MLLTFAVSCSHKLMEPMMNEPYIGRETGLPATKTGASGSQQDEAELLSKAQRNHYLILMHHVELRDSVYVQTLTDTDMQNLKITEAEKAFGEQYVVFMNELIKQQ